MNMGKDNRLSWTRRRKLHVDIRTFTEEGWESNKSYSILWHDRVKHQAYVRDTKKHPMSDEDGNYLSGYPYQILQDASDRLSWLLGHTSEFKPSKLVGRVIDMAKSMFKNKNGMKNKGNKRCVGCKCNNCSPRCYCNECHVSWFGFLLLGKKPSKYQKR